MNGDSDHTLLAAPPAAETPQFASPRLSDEALWHFHEGTQTELWKHFGAHIVSPDESTVRFAVWAPNAESVSVMGDFNGWTKHQNQLSRRDGGVWEGVVPGVSIGSCYKYHIKSRFGDYAVDKADPVAVRHEVPPRQASQVWSLDYRWGDEQWMSERGGRNHVQAAQSIYELHLGSWRRLCEECGRWLTYREIADDLAEHVKKLGFTHVELMPVMEHPFYGSWGYQTTGYFAPTSRYGTPQDLKFLIDRLHHHGIGVILDWVPSHFPGDEHGLAFFDGTHLYEHEDPRQRILPDWDSYAFNYGRPEVRSFLISSARYWLEEYHADGLRVDAVASMLYLDYSRPAGGRVPNRYGGRENLEAIDFLKQLNETVSGAHPDVRMTAEESTAWPLVTKPAYAGGLGFSFKWDMGWMHDTLAYMAHDPVHRKHHHEGLTFRMVYAFHENFILPLSHDEVVHGKGSLLDKMPGDDWQRLASLRLLLGYMYGMPGKKLLFMGTEMASPTEWVHERELPWSLLEQEDRQAFVRWLQALNNAYRGEQTLHELDCDPGGFEWIDTHDAERSVVSFLRKSSRGDLIAAVFNFTPVPRTNYQIGVPASGYWREILNSDALEHGGAGFGNMGGASSVPIPVHGREQSLTLTLPPLGALFLKHEG